MAAHVRRVEVALLLRQWGFDHGVQVRIARHLGVSEATISRDVQALLRGGRVRTR
jgi:DeoR/GlpR family transcriptional regulator of sugar metabolism